MVKVQISSDIKSANSNSFKSTGLDVNCIKVIAQMLSNPICPLVCLSIGVCSILYFIAFNDIDYNNNNHFKSNQLDSIGVKILSDTIQHNSTLKYLGLTVRD